jgi:hypothetical protein
MLSDSSYQDNNNFIEIGHIIAKDNRFDVIKRPNNFRFYDVIPTNTFYANVPLKKSMKFLN